MIARLRGEVVHRGSDHVIVDVQGVGYRVLMPGPAIGVLTLGDEVVLHVSTQVREDAITLFGFPTADDRDAFDILHGVNGVGPKTALALLSDLGLDEVRRAIQASDAPALAKAKGVGKKTAERICLELQEKLPARFSVEHSGAAAQRRHPGDQLPLALAQLEYKKSEIDRALGAGTVPGPDEASLGERLKAALQVLGKGAL